MKKRNVGTFRLAHKMTDFGLSFFGFSSNKLNFVKLMSVLLLQFHCDHLFFHLQSLPSALLFRMMMFVLCHF